MTASIDTVLGRLKSDFETALVASGGGDGSANTIYGYRTNPGNKTRVAISLSYQGRVPTGGGRTTGGNSPTFKILAAVGVTMDTGEDGRISEAELAEADAALNVIEDRIYALVGKGGSSNRNEYWLGVELVEDSERPPQFPDMPNVRIGLIPFRLKMK